MFRRCSNILTIAAICAGAGSFLVPPTFAVDIESFEFNDAVGTPLASAANTANAGNQWFESSGMSPSQVRNFASRPSSYYIVKSSSAIESNYLDISNVTSGTRYLTTRISGWHFEEIADEQFRLAFMNDDDPPDFGNTITAQMQLGRVDGGDVVLTGTALGGGTPVANTATFPAVLENAFEMTLEMNKDADKYKIFYKNGTAPSQVLGSGTVAPDRGGNSLRMVANNNFGDFFINFNSEDNFVDFFAVDRIAVTDTNPHTDLITLEVDRDDGAMTIRNTSGSTISGIESYSITSAAGGLNPAGWMPIGGGTDSSSNEELMQTFGGGGISWTNGQEIPISTGDGAWLKSPFEDVEMVLNLSGGMARTVNVDFIDNGGQRYMPGDFDFMGGITVDDYQILIDNAETDLTALSIAQAYQKGDLDQDLVNSIRDFADFKQRYLEANPGASSFSSIFDGVPEPSTSILAWLAAVVFSFRRKRQTVFPLSNRREPLTLSQYIRSRFTTMRTTMTFVLATLLAALVLCSGTSRVSAAILEDFTFDEPNGTLLVDAQNTANPGNSWNEDSTDMEDATIQNGVYHIGKTNDNFGTNFLDIDNVTSGKIWFVAEIAGWHFSSIVGPGEFDAGQPEEIRLDFLNNDGNEGGSFVTAEARIERVSDGNLEVRGLALGTGTDIASQPLPLTQSDPFTFVLALDKTENTYDVVYRSGTDPFVSLGGGIVDPERDANSVRFAANNNFGGTDEFFDVDRLYVTDTDPVEGPFEPTFLSLIVNTTTRDISLKNETDDPISIDSYRIGSEAESLSFSEWDSLSDRVPLLDPINGGDDPGETWDKAVGSDDGVLAESFLLSSSTLAPDGSPDASLSLGKVFKMGGMQDLTFQYHDAVSGAIVAVEPTYIMSEGVAGDYNENGIVDAADYTVWRDHLGQTTTLPNTDPSDNDNEVTTAEYNFWVSRFGMTAGAGSLSTTEAVPEPATALLSAAVIALTALVRRHRGERRQANCGQPFADRSVVSRCDWPWCN